MVMFSSAFLNANYSIDKSSSTAGGYIGSTSNGDCSGSTHSVSWSASTPSDMKWPVNRNSPNNHKAYALACFGFYDYSKVSAWALDGALLCVNSKIISGYTGDSGFMHLGPQNTLTRAELAQIIYNYKHTDFATSTN